MALLENIEGKQRLLQAELKLVFETLRRWTQKPQGRTVGLKIPDEHRARFNTQLRIWEGASYRQIVQVCMELGLIQLERLGKIYARAKEDEEAPKPRQSYPPPRSGKPDILNMMREIRHDCAESPVEEVSEVSWPDDQGDGGVPAPGRGEEDFSR
jgi:hypothetical protein